MNLKRTIALLVLALTLFASSTLSVLAATQTIDGVTLTQPDTHSSCVDAPTSDTLTITGVASNGGHTLKGQIVVSYILDNGVRQLLHTYPISTTSDVNLTINYPPVSQWPVQSTGTREIHVDVQVEVYKGGFLIGTFGPGLGWDVFCIGAPPPPTIGCTLTQGYYKNHPAALPSTMTLGTVSYTNTQLVSILNQPVQGNGLVDLAHQLIAAKANIAKGASAPAAVQNAIAQANALIGGLVIPPVGSGNLTTASTSTLVSILDQYNNGLAPGGPSHCN